MCESTEQIPSADGQLAHHLTTGQDAIHTITDMLIERGLTLNDLKPVLIYLGTLTECIYQVTVLAAGVVSDVDTKHVAKNGLNCISIFDSLTYVRSLIDANGAFLASIGRELAIASQARSERAAEDKTAPITFS